ncbi:MAG: PDDEXK nuclease domain-containing protein [Clostridium sp.]
MKSPNDNLTIGSLLCKGKDKMVTEYTLKDVNKSMRVSEYKRRRASYHSFLSGAGREPIHFRELHMGNPQEV